MKKYRTLTLLFMAAFVSILIACDKPENAAPPLSFYTITNHVDKPIVVRVFSDTTVDNNRTIENEYLLQIKAHGKVVLPYDKLNPKGQETPPIFKYYWATTDYTLSTWGTKVVNDISETVVDYPSFSYNPAKPVQNIDIYNYDATRDMKRWLNGMKETAVFKATNAYDINGKSVWESQTDSIKNSDLTTTWDGLAEYYVKYSRYYFSFNLQRNMNSKATHLQSVHISHHDSLGKKIKIDEIKVVTKYPNLPDISNDDDKIYLIIDNKPPYYLMVKH